MDHVLTIEVFLHFLMTFQISIVPESLIFEYPTHQKAEAAVALALLLLSRLLEAAAANLVRVQSLGKRPAAKMPLFFFG